jgi:putative nucleotidyltransferase with HDIG domain
MFGQRQSRETWQHSITSAFVAEGLAHFAESYLDPNDAYLAGLTHDLGKTLLRTRFSKEYAAMISSVPPEKPWRLLEAERLAFSIDHAQIGAIMMEKWNLSSDLCAAVKNHHNPAQPDQALCQVVAMANQIAHQYDTPKDHRVFDYQALSSLHLLKDDADNMLFYAQHKIDDFLTKIAGSLF